MNFSPLVKSWIVLICLIVSTGGGVAMLSYGGGAHWQVALISGFITAATNVYHSLSASPKEKADKAASVAPWPKTKTDPTDTTP